MSSYIRIAALALVLGTPACGGPGESGESGGVAATRQASESQGEGAGKKDWRMAAYDESGSGNNAKENQLGRNNVGGLEVKWTFDATRAGEPVAPIHANPVVAGGRTFVGSYGGTFYGIGEAGDLLWKFDTYAPGPLFSLFFGDKAPIVAGAVIPEHEDTVVFGDTDGRVYKLDRSSGALLWTVDLDDTDLGGIWGNSLMISGSTVYVGIASFETLAPFFPGRTCCSHRGAVAALDLQTGTTKWRYEVIDPNSQGPFPQTLIDQLGGVETYGPSGGDVWSQPTLDEHGDTLYIGTGQLFSRSPDGSGPPTHDAVIALDAHTGKKKWVTHLSQNVDVFRFDLSFHDTVTGQYFDKDVDDQPKAYRLPNGRRVVGAGQKSGQYNVLDAETGAVVTTTQLIEMITGEGGFQSGGALDGNTVFEHGGTTPSVAGAPFDGIVTALTGNGTGEKWKITVPGSSLYGGLAVANGVLYFQSPFEESLASPGNPSTWALYAVNSGTGEVLKRIPFAGRAINGPAVSRGRVYVGFGGAFSFGTATTSPEGGVVCLGLHGDHD